MSARPGTFRAWLELLRISNVPTVWSNALVGAAVGVVARPGHSMPWAAAVVAVAAGSLFYVAGMALNGVADVEVDRVERPERPLPSGRIARGAATAFFAVVMVLGLALLTPWGVAALAMGAILCGLIVAYNLLHRIGAWTVVLMGACRGMVYVLAAAVVAGPIDWRWAGPLAGVLTAYTIALSLVARGEADPRSKVQGPESSVQCPVSSVRSRVRIVVAMLCGISLLDSIFLVMLGQPLAAAAAVACFLLAAGMQKRILGT
jgi:4-hydroxybenzoate polyprenyltransferase